MAIYYADFVNGLDANNGLGPDASHATNKPWKTMAKALGAAGIASGDTVYLSPAGQFREVVTVAMTNPVAETKILGDPGNAQGFKTSGGVLVTPGPVICTAFTTDDVTAPSGTTTLNLASRDFLTIRNIMFVGGTGSTCVAGTVNDLKLEDCAFFGSATAGDTLTMVAAFGVAANVTIDRCFFTASTWTNIAITLNTSASGADYDANILIQNCVFVGSYGYNVSVSGDANQTFRGGGVDVRNCLMVGETLRTGNAFTSTSIPCNVYSSVFFWIGNSALNAAAAGKIVENYNVFIGCVTPRTNVTAGANSKTGYAPLISLGQERIFNMLPRPFSEPMAGSPLLAFGDDGGAPAYDLRNWPRPAGGVSALKGVGAYERRNTWGRETATARTGSNALSITGPGYQDFDIPVDASATTVTCYMRQDTTYAGTSPKLIALANAEIGVTEQTDTLAVADDTWEQLSVSFTPTAKGVITIRLLSSDTNGGGKAFADDFGVA